MTNRTPTTDELLADAQRMGLLKESPEEGSSEDSLQRTATDLVGGTIRTALGGLASPIDVIIPGSNASHHVKMAYDKYSELGTGRNYKATTPLGKNLQEYGEYIFPFAAAVKIPKLAGLATKGLEYAAKKVPAKMINYIERGIEGATKTAKNLTPGKVASSASALGKTKTGKAIKYAAKLPLAFMGAKAAKNLATAPTTGNYIGLGVDAAMKDKEGNPAGMSGTAASAGTNLVVDYLTGLLSKGKQKIRSYNITSRVQNPDVADATQELLSKDLKSLTTHQAKEQAKRQAEITKEKKAYDKAIERENNKVEKSRLKNEKSKLEKEEKKYIRKQEEHQKALELQQSVTFSPGLQGSITSKTNRIAGKDLASKAGEANKQHTEEMAPIYKEREDIRNQLRAEQVPADVSDTFNRIGEKVQYMTDRELGNFLQTPEGNVVRNLYDIPSKSTIKNTRNIIYQADPVTFGVAVAAKDVSALNPKISQESSSSQIGSLKKIGSELNAAEQAVMKSHYPEAHERIQEANQKHGEFAARDRPAINTLAEGKVSPGKAYVAFEGDLKAGDAHMLGITKSEAATLNNLRRLGKGKGGKFNSEQSIEGFLSQEKEVRKAQLATLSPERRAEFKNRIQNYKEKRRYEDKKRKKEAKPEKPAKPLAVYKAKEIAKPEAKEPLATPYQKETAEGLENYVNNLDPKHREEVRAIPGVNETIKYNNKLQEHAKKPPESLTWYGNPLQKAKKIPYAIRNTIYKDTMANTAPEILEEIKRQANHNPNENLFQRAGKEMSEITQRQQPLRYNAMNQGSREESMDQEASSEYERQLLEQAKAYGLLR